MYALEPELMIGSLVKQTRISSTYTHVLERKYVYVIGQRNDYHIWLLDSLTLEPVHPKIGFWAHDFELV
jgi:hypothetical protein